MHKVCDLFFGFFHDGGDLVVIHLLKKEQMQDSGVIPVKRGQDSAHRPQLLAPDYGALERIDVGGDLLRDFLRGEEKDPSFAADMVDRLILGD